jgi:hypothetical protein
MSEPTPEYIAIQNALTAAVERAEFARKEERDWKFRAEQAEGAAEKLREALDLSTGRKRAAKPLGIADASAGNGAPKRRNTDWMSHVRAVLDKVGTVDEATKVEFVRPTKKQLMHVLQARVPEANWASVQAFVYQAVANDRIIVRMDQCWLPGTEPPRAI